MSAIDSIAVLRYAEEGPEIARVEDRLEQFERILSVRLPQDYKDFLRWSGRTMILKQNSITPITPPAFPGVRSKPKISWLYGLNDYKINLFTMNETYDGRIPSGLITIGSAGADDQICMNVSDKLDSKIYYWFHEMEVDAHQNKVADYANMFLLARAFTEFAEKLTPEEEVPTNARVKKIALRF